jgi:hypothetical protein
MDFGGKITWTSRQVRRNLTHKFGSPMHPPYRELAVHWGLNHLVSCKSWSQNPDVNFRGVSHRRRCKFVFFFLLRRNLFCCGCGYNNNKNNNNNNNLWKKDKKWEKNRMFLILSHVWARKKVLGSVVGWDTMLQASRSRVQFPMSSLNCFQFPYSSSRTMAPLLTQPLTEISTSKALPARKTDNTIAICEPIM